MNETKKNPSSSENVPGEENTSRKNMLVSWMDSLDSRRTIIFLIAGLYLAYLGYSLAKSVLSGEAGAGFMAGGIFFIVVGLFLAFAGGRGLIREDRRKKAEQEEDARGAQAGQPEAAQEKAGLYEGAEADKDGAKEEEHKMSISERAKLTSRLDDKES